MPHPTRANWAGIGAMLLAVLITWLTGFWLIFVLAVGGYLTLFLNSPAWSDDVRLKR